MTVTVGLSDVGMQTLALRDGKDVVVQQIITNYGDKPIDYSAFALLPGQARQERLVTGLAAGQHGREALPVHERDGPAGDEGAPGVREQAGTRILNDKVPVQ